MEYVNKFCSFTNTHQLLVECLMELKVNAVRFTNTHQLLVECLMELKVNAVRGYRVLYIDVSDRDCDSLLPSRSGPPMGSQVDGRPIQGARLAGNIMVPR